MPVKMTIRATDPYDENADWPGGRDPVVFDTRAEAESDAKMWNAIDRCDIEDIGESV